MSGKVIIKDHGWNKLKKELKLMDNSFVKVGVLGGTHKGKKGESFDMVKLATVHEYGATIDHPGGTAYRVIDGKAVFVSNEDANDFTGGIFALHRTKRHKITIPARPFLAQAYEKYFNEIKAFVIAQKVAVLDGKQDTMTALKKIGLFFKSKVQLVFTEGTFTPLKQATIDEKGSSRPLFDTGRLRASINYEVEIKGS